MDKIIKNLPNEAVEIKSLYFSEQFKSLLYLSYHKNFCLAIENDFQEYYCFGTNFKEVNGVFKMIFALGNYRVIFFGKLPQKYIRDLGQNHNLNISPEILMKYKSHKILKSTDYKKFHLANLKQSTKISKLQYSYIREEVGWQPYWRQSLKKLQEYCRVAIIKKMIFTDSDVTTKVECGENYKKVAKINRVFTIKNKRGQGEAFGCLLAMIDYLLKKKVSHIYLNVRPDNPAVHLYQKVGFVPNGLVYYFTKYEKN